MNLTVGDRLRGYVITEVMHENAWHVLYGGKKVFAHFDYQTHALRESDPHEWLDVCLRTLKYPFPKDRDDVLLRRRMAKLEIQRIYGHGQSRLWPEPVDLFDLENTIDPFADVELRKGEPILVFARPRGQALEAWQQGLLPLTSILAVLAELLAFLEMTHEQGILLQCLHPEHLLIDRAGRVHDLSGDLALDLKHLQTEGGAAPPSWRRLFPDERFPRGFAAPEMYLQPRRIDARSDLFSWGAVAMWLLAGVHPAQIAGEAKLRSAVFQSEHFEQLQRYLADTPPAYIRDWAEQLGLPAAELSADWPANLVNLLRRVLAPNPTQRPESVATLKKWLPRVPPEAPEKILALFQGKGEVQLRLRLPSFLTPDTVLEVRRQVKMPAQKPDQGTLIYDGGVESEVLDKDMPLTDEKIFYTAFLRRGTGERAAYSEGVSAAVAEMDTSPPVDDPFTRERKTLLDRLFAYPVDPQIWPRLETLARLRYAGEADARIVKWLCRRLSSAPDETRAAASAHLADVLLWHQSAERLLPLLAQKARTAAHHRIVSALLLDIGLRLRPPISPAVLHLLLPLLGMKLIPLAFRQRLLIGLWQSTGDGPTSLELLRAYVAKLGKLRAIQQLRDLETLLGPKPQLAMLIGELHEKLRMTCPRCSLVLPRRLMIEHLWNEHRLLLQGDQVRDPWSVIHDWLFEYRQTANPSLWHQATQLARQVDPELGLAKLQRLWAEG